MSITHFASLISLPGPRKQGHTSFYYFCFGIWGLSPVHLCWEKHLHTPLVLRGNCQSHIDVFRVSYLTEPSSDTLLTIGFNFPLDSVSFYFLFSFKSQVSLSQHPYPSIVNSLRVWSPGEEAKCLAAPCP